MLYCIVPAFSFLHLLYLRLYNTALWTQLMKDTIVYSSSWHSTCSLMLLKCHQSHKFFSTTPLIVRTCPKAKLNQRVVVIFLWLPLLVVEYSKLTNPPTCCVWEAAWSVMRLFPVSSLSLRFLTANTWPCSLSSSPVPPTPCRLFRARQPTLRMRVIARKVLYATHLCTFICICLALKFYEVESNSNKNNERGKKEKQTLSKFHGYLNVLPFPASVRRPLPAAHSRWVQHTQFMADWAFRKCLIESNDWQWQEY